jgi:cell division protease FtsH
MPTKNRLSYWRREILDQLIVLMGGRAAEEIFVQDMSSGAQHDISQATRLARSMICEWGMSDELGLVSYDERTESGQYLGMSGYHEKNYSNETAQQIDKQVRKLTEEAYAKAKEILEANRDKVQLMADMLMEFESLDATDVKEIMAGTWNLEAKRGRLKSADDLQRKMPPVPPPIPALQPKPQSGMQPDLNA